MLKAETGRGDRRQGRRETGVARWSGGDQLPDVRDVALAHRSKLVGHDGGDSQGGPGEGHEFYLVGFPATMDVYNGPDIARFQTLGKQVCRQDNAIVFADIHSSKG